MFIFNLFRVQFPAPAFILRQFLPKGSDLSDVTQGELDEISHMLNTRPRKALDFQTPRKVYMEEFKHYHPDY